jgi:hypothetical protein
VPTPVHIAPTALLGATHPQVRTSPITLPACQIYASRLHPTPTKMLATATMTRPYGLGLTGILEPSDNMATQATINRPSYPSMSSYQTPQSNSPASIQSPQTDANGRPIYQMPPMAQQMYYPHYQMPQQSPYSQHTSSSHHSSITSAPGMLMSHQQQQQQQPVSQQPHQPSHSQPGMIDAKPAPSSLQRPPSVVGAPHGTPQTPSGPGKSEPRV